MHCGSGESGLRFVRGEKKERPFFEMSGGNGGLLNRWVGQPGGDSKAEKGIEQWEELVITWKKRSRIGKVKEGERT